MRPRTLYFDDFAASLLPPAIVAAAWVAAAEEAPPAAGRHASCGGGDEEEGFDFDLAIEFAPESPLPPAAASPDLPSDAAAQTPGRGVVWAPEAAPPRSPRTPAAMVACRRLPDAWASPASPAPARSPAINIPGRSPGALLRSSSFRKQPDPAAAAEAAAVAAPPARALSPPQWTLCSSGSPSPSGLSPALSPSPVRLPAFVPASAPAAVALQPPLLSLPLTALPAPAAPRPPAQTPLPAAPAPVPQPASVLQPAAPALLHRVISLSEFLPRNSDAVAGAAAPAPDAPSGGCGGDAAARDQGAFATVDPSHLAPLRAFEPTRLAACFAPAGAAPEALMGPLRHGAQPRATAAQQPLPGAWIGKGGVFKDGGPQAAVHRSPCAITRAAAAAPRPQQWTALPAAADV
jgi:hypothetical protein